MGPASPLLLMITMILVITALSAGRLLVDSVLVVVVDALVTLPERLDILEKFLQCFGVLTPFKTWRAYSRPDGVARSPALQARNYSILTREHFFKNILLIEGPSVRILVVREPYLGEGAFPTLYNGGPAYFALDPACLVPVCNKHALKSLLGPCDIRRGAHAVQQSVREGGPRSFIGVGWLKQSCLWLDYFRLFTGCQRRGIVFSVEGCAM